MMMILGVIFSHPLLVLFIIYPSPEALRKKVR